MQITGIDRVVIRTLDLEAMIDFYCRVLGCTVERRQEEIGLIQLRAGSALIDLVPVDGKLGRMGGRPPGPEGRNMDHLCLALRDFDLDAVRAELQGHGVALGAEGLRYGASGQSVSIYLNDPDGNTIELRG
jgi:catechol 2,3-dioxygenase-like lactoylglutathione lyase family enzyme